MHPEQPTSWTSLDFGSPKGWWSSTASKLLERVWKYVASGHDPRPGADDTARMTETQSSGRGCRGNAPGLNNSFEAGRFATRPRPPPRPDIGAEAPRARGGVAEIGRAGSEQTPKRGCKKGLSQNGYGR
eukprot:9091908-Pyramimonas_sp.AAC.1